MSEKRSYSEKLKDPRWQKLRLECFQRDDYRCLICGSKEKSLNVHHIKYHGEPWGTPLCFLQTLCEGCHDQRTDIDKLLINEIRAIENDVFFVLGNEEPLLVNTPAEVMMSGVMGLIQNAAIEIGHYHTDLSMEDRRHLEGMLHAANSVMQDTLLHLTRLTKRELEKKLEAQEKG